MPFQTYTITYALKLGTRSESDSLKVLLPLLHSAFQISDLVCLVFYDPIHDKFDFKYLDYDTEFSEDTVRSSPLGLRNIVDLFPCDKNTRERLGYLNTFSASLETFTDAPLTSNSLEVTLDVTCPDTSTLHVTVLEATDEPNSPPHFATPVGASRVTTRRRRVVLETPQSRPPPTPPPSSPSKVTASTATATTMNGGGSGTATGDTGGTNGGGSFSIGSNSNPPPPVPPYPLSLPKEPGFLR